MEFWDNLQNVQMLIKLHSFEEECRERALRLISNNEKNILHLEMVQQAMTVADDLRQLPTDDEDVKVIQLLGMRIFNAFASSFQLLASGYCQNSALVMRDILETVFLVDMFRSDRQLISQWRRLDDTKRISKFGPIHVRIYLDKRDGNVKMKRAEHYKVFSEVAGHPTMKSAYMLRHQLDGDAHIGPFISEHLLDIVVTELGSLGFQAAQYLDEFFPDNYERATPSRTQTQIVSQKWFKTFLLVEPVDSPS